MKYWLVTGFFCKVFRKEPRIRLFFDEKLIDEYYLGPEEEKTNLVDPLKNLSHKLSPIPNKQLCEYIRKTLPSLRFYNVEISNKIEKTSVRIEIDNDDSNYTNGFMTKSTLIKCKVLTIIPADEKIYYWFYKKLQARTIRKYNWLRRNNRSYVLGLEQDMYFLNKKNKILLHCDEYIGGSGQISCELKKKYGLLTPLSTKVVRLYPYLQEAAVWRPIKLWYNFLAGLNFEESLRKYEYLEKFNFDQSQSGHSSRGTWA